jgi:hypothetical protein
MGRESDIDGRDVVCGPSFGGVGHRIPIVGPHAAAAVINDNNDNDPRRSGGASCPTPPWFVPSRRMPLVVVHVTNG